MTGFVRTQPSERTFTPATSSIGEARQFVREVTAGVVGDGAPELPGDLELAVSELVTNAVEYGLDAPITVSVTVTPANVLVSVRSARSSSAISDPSTWAGPLPAMRTGRGLAIVRAVSDAVAVEADDTTVTVHCSFDIDRTG
jgi:anti-sigma regulatory factor (Ser/Thr protein kinase)